jgi:aspartyl-tRNA(Asn)/glutamyl-tRNA(Gln) amidotransferase subunit A
LISKSRGEGFGNEVIKRILTGTFVLSSSGYDDYYGSAIDARRILRQDFSSVFQSGVDVILSPTSPILPFPLLYPPSTASMITGDVFTVPANLCGLPAISLPVSTVMKSYITQSSLNEVKECRSNDMNSTTAPLPIGMQLIGKYCGESILFKIALAIEHRAEFNKLVPDWVA